MIVGLLSDSHGKVEITHRAVKLLREAGAELLVHCGDVGSSDVLAELVGGPAVFVFGNTDYDQTSLRQFAESTGIRCGEHRANLALGDKLGVVMHGDDSHAMQEVLRQQAVDYLFLGHTHQPADIRQQRVRIINPGALYRARPRTIALLDTTTDVLRLISLDS